MNKVDKMNSQEKWNYIVKSYKQNYTKPESEVQRSWEDIFSEFFDYKKLCGEIVTQTYIQLGSRTALIPDIVLKKDKEMLADVELKRHTLSIDEHYEKQLISYLKQLNLSIGVIICNKIYLYVFSYPNTIDRIEIAFEEKNERGVTFIELFNKNNFDVDKIKHFVSTEIEKEEKRRDMIVIENEIKRKLNSDYIKECVREYLLLTDCPEDIVENVLKDYAFKVEMKDAPRTYYGDKPDKTGPFSSTPFPVDTDFPETGDFLIIKTSDDRVVVCGNSLYDATRHAWHVKYDNVIRYKYVLAVIKGYVKEVYRVDEWYQAEQWDSDFKNVSNRYEFVGNVAPDDVRQKWIGKLIPEHYRKKGMASPVIFSKPFAREKYI